MKNAGIYIGILCILAACAPSEPPVEPPPETTTTVAPPPETTTTTPPEGRTPEEYPLLDRTPGIIEDLNYNALQANAHAGWRDPLYVVANCQWALLPNPDAVFSMTSDEMLRFAMLGGELDAEGAGFVVRLPNVNKRCGAEHPEHDPRFCQRSDVLRARLNEFRARVDAHLATASELRDAVQRFSKPGARFDSIRGFCERYERPGTP